MGRLTGRFAGQGCCGTSTRKLHSRGYNTPTRAQGQGQGWRIMRGAARAAERLGLCASWSVGLQLLFGFEKTSAEPNDEVRRGPPLSLSGFEMRKPTSSRITRAVCAPRAHVDHNVDGDLQGSTVHGATGATARGRGGASRRVATPTPPSPGTSCRIEHVAVWSLPRCRS